MSKQYDVRIDQGATWTKVIQVNDSNGNPRNLTGFTAKMDMKETYTSTPVLQLSTPASGITINGGAGQITVTITDEQTSAMTWRTGVYDLKITSSGGVAERIIEGSVGVFPQVTV